jgi:hypothetical protein
MFIVLPAAYGVTLSLLIERSLESRKRNVRLRSGSP